MNNDLEYRMYGFVPYNLSEIQKGIQFGHAVIEYQQLCRDIPKLEKIYNKWAIHDKTFIILNGGTTNNNFEREGTLNKIKDKLVNMTIPTASFYEPDLGDQLTAVCFLVDERAWNIEKYPSLELTEGEDENEDEYYHWQLRFPNMNKEQIDKIINLRKFLKSFKLA